MVQHLTRRGALAGGVCVALSGAGARAQEFPARPIRFFVGQAAGSGSDILCRKAAEQVAKLSGLTVIVENRPGAGGNIATQAVASGPADGTSLLFSTSNSLTGNFFLYEKLAFKLEDFAPVATVAQTGFALAVPANGPASVADLTAAMKAKDGKGRYGAPTSSALASAELYLDMAGATATRVPYKSAPQALNDLIGGEIDFFFVDAITALGPARRGQIRLLAVTTPARLAAAPDLPSMDEAGVKGYDLAAWFGVFAPAATPKALRDKLTQWIVQAVSAPEMREFLLATGNEPLPGGPAEVERIVKSHTQTYKRLADSGKIRPAD
ncbi:MAG: tripartite tricarboxylate transporter substrate binding protein [Hyphomicrobiales bacterium]|nr:tripartite tricarboxylate transporter substrate binding protein [Hyphomicrobiales bacterium]